MENYNIWINIHMILNFVLLIFSVLYVYYYKAYRNIEPKHTMSSLYLQFIVIMVCNFIILFMLPLIEHFFNLNMSALILIISWIGTFSSVFNATAIVIYLYAYECDVRYKEKYADAPSWTKAYLKKYEKGAEYVHRRIPSYIRRKKW